MKTITTTLASSDGCTPSAPNSSQRVAPFTGWPNSTATSATATIAEPRPDHHRLPIGAVVDAHDQRHEHESDQRPRRLLEEIEIRIVVRLHRDERRGAVDHHHARAHEQQRGGEQQLV